MERNTEGKVVVDFAKRAEMVVVCIYFKKREERKVTHMSDVGCTQVDYISFRKSNLKEVFDQTV